MNLIHLAEFYIATHARNVGEDVIQHLKAFASEAHAKLAVAEGNVVDTVQQAVKGSESYMEEKAEEVKIAVEEVESHVAGSFAHLLAAQKADDQPTESK